MEKFDIAVIGAGPGGFKAATQCAKKGASVAIIEKDFVGGTCLNYGCIPSKTLLASAHVLLAAKNADAMGINVSSAAPDWHKIQTRRENIINDLRKAMTVSLKNTKAKWFQGQAMATLPNRLKIETGGSTSEIHADKIIIATGSEPIQLTEIPFDGKIIISSKEALSLQQIPKSMVIVGGGVIGCELACIFAAVGTTITIVEMLPFILASEDQWVGKFIEREFKKLSINIFTSQKVVSVDKNNNSAKVFLENGQMIDAEKVLVAVGRKACCDNQTVKTLNLEMRGSAIKVNEKMETSAKGVYAIGDAAGKTYLAHGATTEAEVAAANALGGDVRMCDYSLIPRVIYTFPEAASVGKNEQTCKSQGLNVSVGKAFFRANGRSAASNETVGEIRAVKDNSTNKIIGITMAGVMVTELVAAAAAFIGRQEKDMQITFAHPTISETLKEAVENAFAS